MQKLADKNWPSRSGRSQEISSCRTWKYRSTFILTAWKRQWSLFNDVNVGDIVKMRNLRRSNFAGPAVCSCDTTLVSKEIEEKEKSELEKALQAKSPKTLNNPNFPIFS